MVLNCVSVGLVNLVLVLQGEPGDRGAVGEPGERGEVGDLGPPGPPGDAGVKGFLVGGCLLGYKRIKYGI